MNRIDFATRMKKQLNVPDDTKVGFRVEALSEVVARASIPATHAPAGSSSLTMNAPGRRMKRLIHARLRRVRRLQLIS